MFGSREDRRAREAEADRLASLPIEELATKIMPAFGPDGPHSAMDIGLDHQQVIEYLLVPYPHGSKWPPQLERPVREGLQRLEHANLLYLMHGQQFFSWRITRLGEAALAQGTTEQYLEGSTSPR